MAENLNSTNCLTIGLPKSGKTTFIAALWHVVDSKELEDSLQIKSLPDDRTYLHDIRSKWIACKNLERTTIDGAKDISLEITSIKTGKDFLFHFPDLSGEMFEMHFESRKLDISYASKLKVTKGVLLFINPDKLVHPTLITKDIEVEEEEGAAEGTKPVWKHKDAPTQVVLVDALQVLNEYIDWPVKIAIIISAWDLITNAVGDSGFQAQKPEEYIKNQLPLLYAFIKANDEKFIAEYFGISAQGGEYSGDNSALQGIAVPSERIKVQHGDEKSSDISMPLKWVLGE